MTTSTIPPAAAGGRPASELLARPRRPHPRETEILAALRAGLGNTAVARRLHVDRAAVRRIRQAHNIPAPADHPPTLEQKWQAHAVDTGDGHMQWTGSRGSSSRTPILRHQDTTYSPAAIAFTMRTGRPPVGQVYADCDVTHCIAPAHVLDEPERTRIREQARRLMGRRDLPDRCGKGHDQRTARRFGPDGSPYCNTCVTDRKRKQRAKDTQGAA